MQKDAGDAALRAADAGVARWPGCNPPPAHHRRRRQAELDEDLPRGPSQGRCSDLGLNSPLAATEVHPRSTAWSTPWPTFWSTHVQSWRKYSCPSTGPIPMFSAGPKRGSERRSHPLSASDQRLVYCCSRPRFPSKAAGTIMLRGAPTQPLVRLGLRRLF
jgi:hypothetical protein